jgi:hypothetical protein
MSRIHDLNQRAGARKPQESRAYVGFNAEAALAKLREALELHEYAWLEDDWSLGMQRADAREWMGFQLVTSGRILGGHPVYQRNP